MQPFYFLCKKMFLLFGLNQIENNPFKFVEKKWYKNLTLIIDAILFVLIFNKYILPSDGQNLTRTQQEIIVSIFIVMFSSILSWSAAGYRNLGGGIEFFRIVLSILKIGVIGFQLDFTKNDLGL